jgi:hypothetical protein
MGRGPLALKAFDLAALTRIRCAERRGSPRQTRPEALKVVRRSPHNPDSHDNS